MQKIGLVSDIRYRFTIFPISFIWASRFLICSTASPEISSTTFIWRLASSPCSCALIPFSDTLRVMSRTSAELAAISSIEAERSDTSLLTLSSCSRCLVISSVVCWLVSATSLDAWARSSVLRLISFIELRSAFESSRIVESILRRLATVMFRSSFTFSRGSLSFISACTVRFLLATWERTLPTSCMLSFNWI